MHRHTKWGIVAAILSLTLISTLLISLSVESTHATLVTDDFFPFTSSTGPNPPAGNSRMTYEETDPYATVYSSSQENFQFHLASTAQGVIATDIGYWSDTFSRALVRTDDSSRTLHVFYAKGSGNTMSLWWKRSRNDGATWSDETQIGTSNGRASLPTATVGPNGKDIHISYCYHSSSTYPHWMFYRKLSWNSGTENWDIGSEEIVHQGASGTHPTADSNLVVDSGQIVHIVWTFYDNGATSTSYREYYENNAAGNWNASPSILAQDNAWIIAEIELDSQRNLHVVASYNNLIQWRKATYSSPSTWTWAASWTSVSGSSFTDAWSHVNICMDNSDRLHVAWGGYSTTYRPLKYARKNANDSWQTTITLNSGNYHCFTEVSAYGNMVYISAKYNSGNGQIVYYESANAGSSFGSRTAISDTAYNERFQSRISKYGVNPGFEGAWRSGSAAPYTAKFACIQRHLYFYTDRYPSTGSTAEFTGTWEIKIYVSVTSSGNTLDASIGLTGNGVDTTEYETPVVVKTGINSPGEYTISGFDFSSFPTPLSASPINGRRLFVHFARGTYDITLRYGDTSGYWMGLTTGTVVPERLLGLLFVAPFIPLVAKAAARWLERKPSPDYDRERRGNR